MKLIAHSEITGVRKPQGYGFPNLQNSNNSKPTAVTQSKMTGKKQATNQPGISQSHPHAPGNTKERGQEKRNSTETAHFRQSS